MVYLRRATVRAHRDTGGRFSSIAPIDLCAQTALRRSALRHKLRHPYGPHVASAAPEWAVATLDGLWACCRSVFACATSHRVRAVPCGYHHVSCDHDRGAAGLGPCITRVRPLRLAAVHVAVYTWLSGRPTRNSQRSARRCPPRAASTHALHTAAIDGAWRQSQRSARRRPAAAAAEYADVHPATYCATTAAYRAAPAAYRATTAAYRADVVAYRAAPAAYHAAVVAYARTFGCRARACWEARSCVAARPRPDDVGIGRPSAQRSTRTRLPSEAPIRAFATIAAPSTSPAHGRHLCSNQRRQRTAPACARPTAATCSRMGMSHASHIHARQRAPSTRAIWHSAALTRVSRPRWRRPSARRAARAPPRVPRCAVSPCRAHTGPARRPCRACDRRERDAGRTYRERERKVRYNLETDAVRIGRKQERARPRCAQYYTTQGGGLTDGRERPTAAHCGYGTSATCRACLAPRGHAMHSMSATRTKRGVRRATSRTAAASRRVRVVRRRGRAAFISYSVRVVRHPRHVVSRLCGVRVCGIRVVRHPGCAAPGSCGVRVVPGPCCTASVSRGARVVCWPRRTASVSCGIRVVRRSSRTVSVSCDIRVV